MNYRTYQDSDGMNVFRLYRDFQKEDDFYKQMDFMSFKKHLLDNPDFEKEGAFVAYDDDALIGFIGASCANKKSKSGFIHTFIVKKDYRRRGIGTELLKMAEDYIRSKGKSEVRFVFLSPINWPWYIPNTDHHEHPGAPAVPINSSLYIFLYHRGYAVHGIHEGFHLPLSKYSLPSKIKERIAKNEARGLSVTLYNKEKHRGVDEFVASIEDENPGFAYSIRDNLRRDKPYPFLVALDKNKMIGWTGAIWTEENGRGHFDGIIVDEKYRGLGLGKTLFSLLCFEEKKNGAKYMTFFTGLTNPARYIYLGAGFQVAMSFADMIKKFPA